MNACEIFYDSCKSVSQMVQMLKNDCEYRCESYECVANETRTRRICIIHIAGVSLVLHSTEISIRMLANPYKRLTTTTNALPTIRMACDLLQICCEWLQICCEIAFLANFRSMFLIFVTPQNRA